MVSALDAMPVKALIAGQLEHNGEVCALGAVGRTRGLRMPELDPDEDEWTTREEIMFENDEVRRRDTLEERWARMRRWVARQLGEAT